MANTVEVRVTAFIPQDWIEFMRTSAVRILYNGNNRSFSYWTENNPHAFKLASHCVVNFVNKTVTHYKDVGPTIERTVDINTGQVIREDIKGQASKDGVKMTSYLFDPLQGNWADIKLSADVAIPTFNPSPAINWNYTIRVNKNGTVSVQGTHDGYPAHEIWKRVDSSPYPVSIHQYHPSSSGHTVHTGLFPMASQNVNAQA